MEQPERGVFSQRCRTLLEEWDKWWKVPSNDSRTGASGLLTPGAIRTYFSTRQAGLMRLRGTFVFNHGETDMGDKGKKDKGKREQQKKALRNLKEKRKQKKEKKK